MAGRRSIVRKFKKIFNGGTSSEPTNKQDKVPLLIQEEDENTELQDDAPPKEEKEATAVGSMIKKYKQKYREYKEEQKEEKRIVKDAEKTWGKYGMYGSRMHRT